MTAPTGAGRIARSRTSSGVPGWVWGGAAATSLVVHGLVLGAIGSGARVSAPAVDVDPTLRIGVPPEAAALIDLAALDEGVPPDAPASSLQWT